MSDDLTLSFTKQFGCSPELLFATETDVAHVRHTIAPFGEQVDVCEIDLRVGGQYHFVFTPEGGEPCSFRGEFLEVDSPRKVSATWIFDGWPDVVAVETKTFTATETGTSLLYELTFEDMNGRSRMGMRGLEANYDNLERYVTSLTSNEK